jgi:hypothetical protein
METLGMHGEGHVWQNQRANRMSWDTLVYGCLTQAWRAAAPFSVQE